MNPSHFGTFRPQIWLGTLAAAALLCTQPSAFAQVAGTTVLGVTTLEATQVAMGWSAKKSILDKAVYNDQGQKLGEVRDVIITPDHSVSYLIIGAGGFIGIGRHDVAVPIGQIKDTGGRLVMAGATKEVVKAMPRFEYTDHAQLRKAFMTDAEQSLARARRSMVDLEKSTANGTAEAKAKLATQKVEVEADLKAAEARLTEMRQATVVRWKEFEAAVTAATAKVKKSVENAVS